MKVYRSENPVDLLAWAQPACNYPLLDRTVTVGYGNDELHATNMDASLPSSITPNEKNVKKRKNDTLSSPIEDENNSFARFLVVTANNLEPIKYSIFAIQKMLKCAVGDVASAKKLANGSVLVEVVSKQQEKNALKMKNWVDIPISVSPHRSLNSCRGVIRCREFRDCDDAEVLDELRDQGATEVKHIISKKNGITMPTNTFIITFNKATLPKFIVAAYMRIAVEPYIPNPLRCFNCQRFGHGKTSCKRQAVCAKFGQEGHQDTDCQNPPHCANCSAAHAAFSRECPTWTKQRAITQIKFERNISFFEARRLVEGQDTAGTKRPGVSYAKVATSTQTCSAATQTELTWPLDSKMPISVANLTVRKIQNTCSVQTETTSSGKPLSKSQTSTKVITDNKAKTPKPGPASKTLSNRSRKGANNPIAQFNKYGTLHDDDDGDDDMEYEVTRAKSVSPSTRKKPPKSSSNG